MAFHGFITITGKTQGLISAGCSTQESVGNKGLNEHVDEIMILALTHNISSFENNRHAIHSPLVISKHVDKSSPLLARALSTREEINCVINLYRTSIFGGREMYYSIKLEGAQLSDLTFDMPDVVSHNDAEAQEQLAIKYRSIIWTHHAAGTSGYSVWGEAE
ncbi:MAG: Hcp family type VI secretion system effector [Pseudomonas sp.]|uniref:Hcp family type VI secretion system effector n=1 Tax=Pseudomonas sp. TaxID=306 RepID=UPI002FCA44DC